MKIESSRVHIAFTKDWNDVPTCTTHILRQIGKNEPVLWVESIGTRKPQLSQSRDLGRIINRLKRVWTPSSHKENHLSVLSPVLIPLATKPWEIKVNQSLFRFYLKREGLLAPDLELVFWCFIPSAIDLIQPFSDRAKIVYYCVDDWPKFENLPTDYITERENNTLNTATTIFATSLYLKNKCEQLTNQTIHYMPHGVPYETFATAIEPTTSLPESFPKTDNKIIGFYGTINDWIDFDLIETLAQQKPEWEFLMLGPIYTDAIERFKTLKNVHFPGRVEYCDLPAWCKGFDVAIIPYNLKNPRMESVNPVKSRELLSAGVPVVAAALQDLVCLEPDISIAHSTDEWIQMLEKQVVRTDRTDISKRRQGDTWENKTKEILHLIA